FSGFEEGEGLRPPEGPAANVPGARWGVPVRTVVSFRSDGAPALLLMEVRRNERLDQRMTIRLNGETVAAYDFGRSRQFWPIRQPLAARAGENVLEFDYEPEPEGSKERGSVLFKRLQVVPGEP